MVNTLRTDITNDNTEIKIEWSESSLYFRRENSNNSPNITTVVVKYIFYPYRDDFKFENVSVGWTSFANILKLPYVLTQVHFNGAWFNYISGASEGMSDPVIWSLISRDITSALLAYEHVA
jgi:hypothetical protein